jgi:hypothetical protein
MSATKTSRAKSIKPPRKEAGSLTWAQMDRMIQAQVKRSSKTLKALAKL